MLTNADRNIQEVITLFTERGVEAGLLVPTTTGLDKSIMDAYAELSDYFCKAGIHDYSMQTRGSAAKVLIKTWIVDKDGLIETQSSLYRPETKSGDNRIWIYNLNKHASAGNLLAVLVYENEIFVVNTSKQGVLDSIDDASSPLSRLLNDMTDVKTKPLNDRFSEWNLRLLRSFFSEASIGEEVFLRVDKDFLDQIGQDIGGDAGFLKAVQRGPSWNNPNCSFVNQILTLVEQRKFCPRNYKDPGHFDSSYRKLHAPSYLPYLAALVRNDSENPTSYYEKLRSELSLSQPFSQSEMHEVEKAWEDLQKWTELNNGRFGYFKLRRLGGYRLIGVPRSQSILKPKDIELLPCVFVQAQIRPGQELSNDFLVRILDEARATKWLFTAGFQKALQIPAFEQPISVAITSAYADWDGTLPQRETSQNNSTNTNFSATRGVGISLVILDDYPLEVAPLWRIPAIVDSGKFEISYEEQKWQGQFSGTEEANTIRYRNIEPTFWKLIERASTNSLEFQIKQFGNEDSEPSISEIILREHPLWVLVPTVDSLTGNPILREGVLPGSGSAFLLAPPESSVALKMYLDREQPEHELISAKGIPEGWLFCCLDDCSKLTEEQRLLPDGEERAHPKPRIIRFIGGRAIRRGYSRMYLPYDLPLVELDAQEDIYIDSPAGVEIREKTNSNTISYPDSSIFKPMRRYEISLSNSQSASYEFLARGKDGAIHSKAKLKVAGLGGDLVESKGAFSLDNLGKPIASDDGLRGVVLGTFKKHMMEDTAPLVGFDIQSSDLGNTFKAEPLNPEVHKLFLDALAQSGSMNYGVARDLIQRLLLSQNEESEPTSVLWELRRLGHLEVSTTHKGHMAKIHSTNPSIYSLPSTCSGKPIWAIAGTLRLDHWKALVDESTFWSTHRLKRETTSFVFWRLVVEDEVEAKLRLLDLGFLFTPNPCSSIVDWSASLESFRQQTFENTMESIGNASDKALRLNASKGKFTASPSGVTSELWKIRDLDTGMDNLYVLVEHGKYSFVRDSRWGVWLALDAFARWFKSITNDSSVHPIPLMYDKNNGTIWIPARVGLPTILERALVLCSGISPEVLSLRKQQFDESQSRVLLRHKDGYADVLKANTFYSDMAEGKWLAYLNVPQYIAEEFSKKLGVELDLI